MLHSTFQKQRPWHSHRSICLKNDVQSNLLTEPRCVEYHSDERDNENGSKIDIQGSEDTLLPRIPYPSLSNL
jgi:hypothetical protein